MYFFAKYGNATWKTVATPDPPIFRETHWLGENTGENNSLWSLLSHIISEKPFTFLETSSFSVQNGVMVSGPVSLFRGFNETRLPRAGERLNPFRAVQPPNPSSPKTIRPGPGWHRAEPGPRLGQSEDHVPPGTGLAHGAPCDPNGANGRPRGFLQGLFVPPGTGLAHGAPCDPNGANGRPRGFLQALFRAWLLAS